MHRDLDLEATLVAKYVVMGPLLNEQTRRLWAAAELIAIGFGGDAIVSSATVLARQTSRNGRHEPEPALSCSTICWIPSTTTAATDPSPAKKRRARWADRERSWTAAVPGGPAGPQENSVGGAKGRA